MAGCYGNCIEDRHFSSVLSKYEDQLYQDNREMEVCENCEEWFDIEESNADDSERFCSVKCEAERDFE